MEKWEKERLEPGLLGLSLELYVKIFPICSWGGLNFPMGLQLPQAFKEGRLSVKGQVVNV